MLLSLGIFVAASLLCALAQTMETLIVGRALQGAGASGMGMMVNVIICDSFSLRERGLYLAVMSGVWAVGSAVGPVVGGVFTIELKYVFLSFSFFLLCWVAVDGRVEGEKGGGGIKGIENAWTC